MKINNNISVNTNPITSLHVCTHDGRCDDDDAEKRKQERQKALQPDLIALLCVYVLHAWLKVLNYAEEKAD